jgi:putative peptidoglycan lipid II flippase
MPTRARDRTRGLESLPHVPLRPVADQPRTGRLAIAAPTPSVARSTAIMSIGTVLARLAGFVRQWSMAVALGVSVAATGSIPIASSFNIANNIPNMIYELVAGGVLSAMFVPMFLEKLDSDGESSAFKMANTLFSLFLVVLGIVALIGTIFPEPFVWTQTLTKSAVDRQLAVALFRFFAVQIIFYAFVALTTGILGSYRRFFAPAIAPLFNNIVVIVAMLGFYVPLRDTRPDLAIVALGVGTTLGVVALFAAQVPALLKVGFRFRWSMDLADPALRKMLRKGIWVLVYVAVNMVQISFRNAFATATMPDGSAALQYAWMWYMLPYGVLAVSYCTAVFTELSTAANGRDWDAFKRYFARGLRAMSLLILPSAAMLLALGTPLVSLYRFGRFPAEAVPLVTAALAGWALGLFFFSASMLVLRALYALQDTRTPALVNVVLTVVQVALYWALPKLIGGQYALVGIPLADSIFFGLLLAALLVVLRRRIGGFGFGHVLDGWARSLAGGGPGGVTAWGIVFALSGLGADAASNILRVLVGATVGLGVSYMTLKLLRVDEISYVDGLVGLAMAKLRPASRP